MAGEVFASNTPSDAGMLVEKSSCMEMQFGESRLSSS